jgi:putative redox protein
MGGCSAFDVVHILAKGREAIEDVVLELDAERAQPDPKVFSRIHMHFVVKGRGLRRGPGMP